MNQMPYVYTGRTQYCYYQFSCYFHSQKLEAHAQHAPTLGRSGKATGSLKVQ